MGDSSASYIHMVAVLFFVSGLIWMILSYVFDPFSCFGFGHPRFIFDL